MEEKGITRLLLEALLKMMIVVVVFQSVMWISIFMFSKSNFNAKLAELISIVAVDNCLDTATGQYQFYATELVWDNETQLFMQFPLSTNARINKNNAKTFKDWKVTYPNGQFGDDCFTVERADNHKGCYNFIDAPQKGQKIEVGLKANIYLPLLFYPSTQQHTKEGYLNNDTTGMVQRHPQTGKISIMVPLEEKYTVVGTKYFKTKPIDGSER